MTGQRLLLEGSTIISVATFFHDPDDPLSKQFGQLDACAMLRGPGLGDDISTVRNFLPLS